MILQLRKQVESLFSTKYGEEPYCIMDLKMCCYFSTQKDLQGQSFYSSLINHNCIVDYFPITALQVLWSIIYFVEYCIIFSSGGSGPA